jgi:uncharacterized membrane protein (DUF485 family)
MLPPSADLPLEIGEPPVADELVQIARRRDRIAIVLTAIMTTAYFGFIALVAFAKPTAGTLLFDGRVSVGIVAGALVIVLAPVLTAFYVRWANRHYDSVVRRVRGGRS